jgi:hypothetical protein
MTAPTVSSFQVEHLAHHRALARLELEQLARHRVRKAVHAGDAVTDLHHAPDLGHFKLARNTARSHA